MTFQVHVLTRSRVTGLSEWVAMRPSKAARPYTFATREEAERAARLGYDADPSRVRVVEA